MNRRELLERVNKRASACYGITISDNVFSDILESKIIKTPEKHGRIRNWTRREYRQLLEIARLKSFGISDHPQISSMMWLKGRNVSPMAFNRNWRKSQARNFDEKIVGLFRGIHSTYPEVRNREPNGYPARTVLLKMGPLDECFSGVIKYEQRELLGLYELMRYGNDISPDIVAGIIIRIIPPSISWIFKLLEVPLSSVVGTTAHLVLRMFGDLARKPEEEYSAVAQSILRASPAQFEHARRLIDLAIIIFHCPGFRKVAVSLRHPSWRLLILGLIVHGVFRSSQMSQKWLPNKADLDAANSLLT